MMNMPPRASVTVPVASRVGRVDYAIRTVMAAAQEMERAGRTVRYLNIGDPVSFGFTTPPHMIAAVERAMRDGHNGYASSPGIPAAREAVAAEYTKRGVPTTADRVLITAGTSEGIDLTLSALAGEGDEVLVPVPNYPLYTAVLAKIGAQAVHYRTDPTHGWEVDLDHLRSCITSRSRALVVIDPNNPTGAVYSTATRRALLNLADRHGLAILADEVYGDLRYDGPVAPIGSLDLDAPVISFSSLSKAYLAPGWRTGWLTVGQSDRLDAVLPAIRKLSDGRLCSNVPMQYGLAAALTGDRSYQADFRAALRLRADLTTTRLNAIEGMRCVRPMAAFYAMPQVTLRAGQTDEEYVLGLLRSTGVLCVYGSGFGLPAADGFLRLVFLAAPGDLAEIYDEIATFTREFLRT